jgi:Type IV secretion system pilin
VLPEEKMTAASITNITNLFENLLNVAMTVGLTVAALFLAWAGFLYMTAGGSPRRMESAKDAAFAAVGGLAIVLLAKTLAALVNGAINTAASH